MSIDEILGLARTVVVPPFSALFLYGSCARGDQEESSDIDVLQVTPTHTAAYAQGIVNITCYTPEQLASLAKIGSLFVKHLVLEAIPLVDPTNFLITLKRTYTPPTDYRDVYSAVKGALPIVAIPESVFEEDAFHYSATAGYLLRTYVYAKAFTLGALSFSMRHVEGVIGDTRPRERINALRRYKTYSQFRSVVDLLFELTNSAPFYRNESLEAFVVNSYGACDLAVILGLRILAHGNLLAYPVIQPTL